MTDSGELTIDHADSRAALRRPKSRSWRRAHRRRHHIGRATTILAQGVVVRDLLADQKLSHTAGKTVDATMIAD